MILMSKYKGQHGGKKGKKNRHLQQCPKENIFLSEVLPNTWILFSFSVFMGRFAFFTPLMYSPFAGRNSTWISPSLRWGGCWERRRKGWRRCSSRMGRRWRRWGVIWGWWWTREGGRGEVRRGQWRTKKWWVHRWKHMASIYSPCHPRAWRTKWGGRRQEQGKLWRKSWPPPWWIPSSTQSW